MNFTSFFRNDLFSFRLAIPATVLTFAALGVACNDDSSKIGSSLTTDEVSISIDTLKFDLGAKPVENNNFDSRTGNLLIGNINVPEYGKLNCAFVTRMMCSTNLNLPDSLLDPSRVDSCKFVMYIKRGELTGDSLAPQKVSVYGLTRQLPNDITNTFNPEGYYNPSDRLGTASFTTSLAGAIDTTFHNTSNNVLRIVVPMPKEMGAKIFKEYKEIPEMFQWPATFAKEYPGYYVESSFGKGCVANIAQIYLMVYFNYKKSSTSVVDGESVTKVETVAEFVAPFTNSPEVLSSNNISYEVSDFIQGMIDDGKTIITTPGGYNAKFTFPAEELIRHYKKEEHNLSVIGDLTLSIPAEAIENDFNIGTAPTLMIIKSSELNDFFNQNKVPDGKSSFSAEYDATNNRYKFSSMRNYIIDLLNKPTITKEDVEFTVLPISLSTESVNNYDGSTTVYITKCTPYTLKPTLTWLKTDDASIVFTFSSQIID